MTQNKPAILSSIADFSRWTIENPFNGMDYLVIRAFDAEFIEPFGPWQKGDKAHTLTFDPVSGSLTETDSWGEIIRACSLSVSSSEEADYGNP